MTGLAVTRDGGVIGAGHLDYIGSDGHGSAGIIRLSSRGTPVTSFGTRGPRRGRVHEERRRLCAVVPVRPHRRRTWTDHDHRRRLDEPWRGPAERAADRSRQARSDVRHRRPGEHTGFVRLQHDHVRRDDHARRCADRRGLGSARAAPRERSPGHTIFPWRRAADPTTTGRRRPGGRTRAAREPS